MVLVIRLCNGWENRSTTRPPWDVRLKVVPSAVVRVGPQVGALFGQKEVRE